jgi:hypothetical protein
MLIAVSVLGLVGVGVNQRPTGGEGGWHLSVFLQTAAYADVSSGVAWSILPSINPGHATTTNTLSSISCGAAGSCLAVGGSTYLSGALANLAEAWNGQALSLVPSLVPGPSVALSSVSCVSPDSCFVLGLTTNGSEASAAWTNTAVPSWSLLPGGRDIDLNAVSCLAKAFCTAVGLQDGGAVDKTLAESWSGKRWSVVPTPNGGPTRDYDNLNGVSCASRLFCVAVGTYGLKTAHRLFSSKTLVEVWNGTRWSVVPSPNEGPSADFDLLNSVSCASSTFCIAVGSYSNYGGGIERTLVERWNGTTWSILSSPNRGGLYYPNELNGVSCLSRNKCVAVGDYDMASGAELRKTLVESWTGSRWALDASATGGPLSDASLTSVSCINAKACVAVGEVRAGPSQPYRTLVEAQTAAKLAVSSSGR